MPRFAYKMTPAFFDMVSGFFGIDTSSVEVQHALSGAYVLITMVTPTELNFKIVSEDEVFEEYKKDNTLHIITEEV